MRNPNNEEKAILRALWADFRAKAAAANEARGLYIQAVTAHAYLCGVPPRDSTVIHEGDGDEPTWDWMVRVGEMPDGQPVLKPLIETPENVIPPEVAE